MIEALKRRPSVIYRRDPKAYWRYDLTALVLTWAVAGTLWFTGWRGFDVRWWAGLLALPLAIYVHVAANAIVHNCCHDNLPRAINRLVGEVLGALVVVRFFGWEVLHTRHHAHPDDPERDPHPCQPSFARYIVSMFTNLERQFHAMRRERFPDRMRYEGARTIVTLCADLSLLFGWGFVLGWPLYFTMFLPAQLVGWLVVAHFNWATHNGDDPERKYGPRDLDHGYFWVGNRLWFGLYMHGTHHRFAGRFNPLPPQRRGWRTPPLPRPVREDPASSGG